MHFAWLFLLVAVATTTQVWAQSSAESEELAALIAANAAAIIALDARVQALEDGGPPKLTDCGPSKNAILRARLTLARLRQRDD